MILRFLLSDQEKKNKKSDFRFWFLLTSQRGTVRSVAQIELQAYVFFHIDMPGCSGAMVFDNIFPTMLQGLLHLHYTPDETYSGHQHMHCSSILSSTQSPTFS
jgi:hypothetical protein